MSLGDSATIIITIRQLQTKIIITLHKMKKNKKKKVMIPMITVIAQVIKKYQKKNIKHLKSIKPPIKIIVLILPKFQDRINTTKFI